MESDQIEAGLPSDHQHEGRQKEPWPKLATLFSSFRDGKRSDLKEKDPRLLSTQFFPRSDRTPEHLEALRPAFERMHDYAFDRGCAGWNVESNVALKQIAPTLSQDFGYSVERYPAGNVNRLPILFGADSTTLRYHDADAYHRDLRTIIEVEAGTATANNAYLKDIFEASMVVGADYLALAVRKIYQSQKGGPSYDFRIVYDALDTIYASRRIHLELKGILLVGY